MTKITKRVTVPDIRQRKGGEPLVMLTAYTAPVAHAADAHCDMLLVGDSMGMVIYGLPSTHGVTLEMMQQHGAAVVRASKRALVVVDMPFGTYESSKEQAFTNAAQLVSATGCNAVKLEGGVPMAETIRFLTRRGIAVMGHVGLTPQHKQVLGGFRAQGRNEEAAQLIVEDAKAVAEAGAFAVVLEGVYESLGALVTQAVNIPVIGIGASRDCDGQVLVTEDMAGMTSGFVPKFVKRYGDMASELTQAIERYAADVRARQFPTDDQCYHLPQAVKDQA